MSLPLLVNRASTLDEIRGSVKNIMRVYSEVLPSDRNAAVLLKPNLNANMNALTGNTTDLRLIAAVVGTLKDKGYQNITIGEGTNSGYYRNNISVISRLKVDTLARHYGIKVADLNYSEQVYIDFEAGARAGVAKACFEADLIINMPKLKTHFEVGMSVCLKNLMGCLVGQENKKKTHKSLARNILNMNKRIKPHLHIVDGIIAMEGLGPTRGTPINTHVIIAGKDPYLIDLACAKIAGLDYRKVSTLKLLEDDGVLTKEHHQFIESLDLSGTATKFQEPRANLLVSFIHSPKRQRYFLAVRNTRLFNYLCSTRFVGSILFRTGLRQDNFILEEMELERLTFDRNRCSKGCKKCADYCPIGLEPPKAIERQDRDCIGCLYCFLVCPACAIQFKGKLGFMAEQLRQYGDITREVT